MGQQGFIENNEQDEKVDQHVENMEVTVASLDDPRVYREVDLLYKKTVVLIIVIIIKWG